MPKYKRLHFLSQIASDEEIGFRKNTVAKQPVPIKGSGGPAITFDSGIKAVTWYDGKRVYTDEEKFTFSILEVTIVDKMGDEVPAYTIGRYNIKPNQRTRWTSYNVNALYYVRTGEAWFLIGEDGNVIKNMYWLTVPANTRHMITNQSAVNNAIVELIFPGKIMVGTT